MWSFVPGWLGSTHPAWYAHTPATARGRGTGQRGSCAGATPSRRAWSEGSSMRRLLLALVAALVAMVMVASPAGAITYGEPDAGEHPYVGFMIFFDPTAPGWFSCSGTLLDADLFLTRKFHGVQAGGSNPAKPGSSSVA